MASSKVILDVRNSVEAVRETVGWDVDLAVDFHGRLAKSQAVALCHELKPSMALWIEDAISPDSMQAQSVLRSRSQVTLATGERLSKLLEFRDLLELRAADVIRPDPGIVVV